jgi:hypothetical protein
MITTNRIATQLARPSIVIDDSLLDRLFNPPSAKRPSKHNGDLSEHALTLQRALQKHFRTLVQLPHGLTSKRRFHREVRRATQRLRGVHTEFMRFARSIFSASLLASEDITPEDFQAIRDEVADKILGRLKRIPLPAGDDLDRRFWEKHRDFNGDWSHVYQPTLNGAASELAQRMIAALNAAQKVGLFGRVTRVDHETVEATYAEFHLRLASRAAGQAAGTGKRRGHHEGRIDGRHGVYQMTEHLHTVQGTACLDILRAQHIHTLVDSSVKPATRLRLLPRRFRPVVRHAPVWLKNHLYMVDGEIAHASTREEVWGTHQYKTSWTEWRREERFLHDPVVVLGEDGYVIFGWLPEPPLWRRLMGGPGRAALRLSAKYLVAAPLVALAATAGVAMPAFRLLHHYVFGDPKLFPYVPVFCVMLPLLWFATALVMHDSRTSSSVTHTHRP